jgi:hypothetical protein
LLISWFRISLIFLIYLSIVHIVIVSILMARHYFLFTRLYKLRRSIMIVHLLLIFVFNTFACGGWMVLLNRLLCVDIVFRGEWHELTTWGKIWSEGIKA